MCEDLKEPIVFKTDEIRVKVESCLNNLEFADILQTCEFLGYLDGITGIKNAGIYCPFADCYDFVNVATFNITTKDKGYFPRCHQSFFFRQVHDLSPGLISRRWSTTRMMFLPFLAS